MSPATPLRSIADVERDTGVPRATVRIWERRYGFPAPERDERGERRYTQAQVDQLRQMRQLIEQGHRPAKLIAGGAAQIALLCAGSGAKAPSVSRGAAHLLRLLREHDPQAVLDELRARLMRLGLADFIGVEIAGMNTQVGYAWASGALQVHEEHLYSDCVYEVVRTAIAKRDRRVRAKAPRVVLTTFPQETHGLGLVMAQAMFAWQGCPTVSLGVRMPVEQIVSSAKAYRANLVGLSFTAAMKPAHVQRGLEELRGMVPADVRIWAGGSNPALAKRTIPGVRHVADVRSIPDLLAQDFGLRPRT